MKLSNGQLIMKMEKQTSVDAIFTQFHISRKQRYILYRDGCVSINHTCISQAKTLFPKDTLIIQMRDKSDTIQPWHKPIDIAYEDDLFLIVNKPSQMLVHSDGNNTTHTLCNAVKHYYDSTKQACLVRPIHRLDVETSGLIIFCKCSFFQPLLDAMLQAKKINRLYLAFVEGRLSKHTYNIEKNIARDRHQSNRMRISKQGSYAKTMITLKQQYKSYALVECQIYTGRTHQIRVHLASLCHSILADPLYGSPSPFINRCALHAHRITFYHPLLNKSCIVECDLPMDMQNLSLSRVDH